MFPGRVTPVAAPAGFVGLLSLFNMAGRIFWASLSDNIGRKNTYFASSRSASCSTRWCPRPGAIGGDACSCSASASSSPCTAAVFRPCRPISRTSSGPLCRGDPRMLITAWSVAGVVGPVLGRTTSASVSDRQRRAAQALVYDITLYIMAACSFGGLLCNLFVKAVHDKHTYERGGTRPRARAAAGGPGHASAETAARGALRGRDVGLARGWGSVPRRPLYRPGKGRRAFRVER